MAASAHKQMLIDGLHIHGGSSEALRDVGETFCDLFSPLIMYNKGDKIIFESDASMHIFFLLEGVIAEIGRTNHGALYIPRAMTRNSWFYNIERSISGRTSTTEYTCLTKVALLRCRESDFQNLRQHEAFEELFFTLNQRILGDTRSHFMRLLHMTPRAHYQWLSANNPDLIKFLTRNQMAAYLGISRATFFRLLAKHAPND